VAMLLLLRWWFGGLDAIAEAHPHRGTPALSITEH
jgi:hypothetical protein